MCAALAPILSASPAAIDELLNVLEHHAREIDSWFVEVPPQFLVVTSSMVSKGRACRART
jgi:hypothetical protein